MNLKKRPLPSLTRFWIGALVLAMSIQAASLSRAEAAESGGALYLGGLLGLSFVNNDVGTKIPVGVHLGYKLHDFPVSVGPYFLFTSLGTSDFQASAGAPTTRVDRGSISFWGADVNTYFGGGLDGFHVGGRIGVGRQSVPGVDVKSQFAIGPYLGLDRFIVPGITVGGEVGLNLVTSDPALTFLNVLATAKLWL